MSDHSLKAVPNIDISNNLQMGNSQPSAIDYSIRAPYDEQDGRFVRSFAMDADEKKIAEFYKTYGFIVFDNMLGEDEINRSIDDLWDSYPGAVREDPSTWDLAAHPFSFAGDHPSDGVQLWDNRQNPNVYAAFKLAYEASSGKPLNEPLVSCLDRGSLMLPTKGPFGKEDYMATRIPHFDLNPYVWCGMCKGKDMPKYLSYEHYNLMLSEGNNTASHGLPKLRAVLQLSESTEFAGGFECMVGFHRQISQWCKLNAIKKASVNPYGWGVPHNDPIEQNLQKITVRKGSLIIFTAELPHTMFPNESEQFRYAQYLRMAPLSTLELSDEAFAKRRALLKAHMPTGLQVSELGREVFLLK